MAGLTNQDLFRGMANLSSNDISHHSISTDHPYMIDIGLGTFTLNELYRWASYRNSKGIFVNLKFFNGLNYSPLRSGETLENRILRGKIGGVILGTSASTVCKPLDYLVFYRWKKYNKSGKYIKNFYYKWRNNKYSFNDINFSFYQDKAVQLISRPGIFDPFKDIEFVSSIHIDSIISSIVTINDLAKYLPSLRDFYIENQLPVSWSAAYDYVYDIKNSKFGCLKWNAVIDFVTWIGNQRCIKSECVNFTLHLFDHINAKNPNRPIALNSDKLFVALPRQDVFGRLAKNDGTGDLESPDLENINTVAGQLALSINPADGKVYSGSPSVIVKLDEDLPVAVWPPNIAGPPASELSSNYGPGTAMAVPIAEQNGNPLQWASQYNVQKCFNKNHERFRIRVQNFSTNRAHPSGTIGMATKVDSQTYWTFQALDAPKNSAPYGWSFTYLMMNFDNFFRARPDEIQTFGGFLIVPKNNDYSDQEYQSAVHSAYYNSSISTSLPSDINLDNYPPIQVTSWDFMGPKIGGQHIGNALSTTSFNIKPDGSPWANYDYGHYSFPFFGCVFPGGYVDNGKYNTLMPTTRNYEVYHYNGPKMSVSAPADGSLTSHLNYIKPVASLTHVFDNDQNIAGNLRGNGFDAGIFINAAQGLAYKHLPADIALNSPPGEKFTGGPLIDYYHIYDAFQLTKGIPRNYSTGIDALIGKNSVNRQVYIHEEGNPQSPMFGMTPQDPFTIQFRPLKHEVYDAFQDIGGNSNPIDYIYAKGKFAREAVRYQKNSAMPIWNGVITRGTPWNNGSFNWPQPPVNVVNGAMPVIPHRYFGKTGMLIPTEIVSNSFSLRYNKELIHYQQFTELFGGNPVPEAPFTGREGSSVRYPYWTWEFKDFRNIRRNNEYPFAYPAKPAGAFGVIGASCSMMFNTTLVLKTLSYIGMNSSYVVDTGPFAQPWYYTFGGDGDEEKSRQNTQLWVKIYHAWPKEYTVYDPGKFAVFHFNPETSDLDIEDYGANIIGQRVYGNTSVTPTILKHRYRKLLPYQYYMHNTIGVDIDQYTFIVGQTQGAAFPSIYSTIIDSVGAGYSPADIFKVSGGGGVSPELAPIIGQGGSVIGFSYRNTQNKGYGYSPEDFLESSEQMDDNDAGLDIICTSTATGTGFAGRAVRGIGVKSPLLQDSGPLQVGDKISLTPIAPLPEDPSSTMTPAVVSQLSKTVTITDLNRSPNNIYDLFFHFHNDTSHTLIGSYGDQLPLEQMVQLTLEPN